MTPLTVQRSDDGAVAFSFGGGSPEVLMVAVVDDEVELPVWVLGGDAFTERLPFTVEGGENESLASADETVLGLKQGDLDGLFGAGLRSATRTRGGA